MASSGGSRGYDARRLGAPADPSGARVASEEARDEALTKTTTAGARRAYLHRGIDELAKRGDDDALEGMLETVLYQHGWKIDFHDRGPCLDLPIEVKRGTLHAMVDGVSDERSIKDEAGEASLIDLMLERLLGYEAFHTQFELEAADGLAPKEAA